MKIKDLEINKDIAYAISRKNGDIIKGILVKQKETNDTLFINLFTNIVEGNTEEYKIESDKESGDCYLIINGEREAVEIKNTFIIEDHFRRVWYSNFEHDWHWVKTMIGNDLIIEIEVIGEKYLKDEKELEDIILDFNGIGFTDDQEALDWLNKKNSENVWEGKLFDIKTFDYKDKEDPKKEVNRKKWVDIWLNKEEIKILKSVKTEDESISQFFLDRAFDIINLEYKSFQKYTDLKDRYMIRILLSNEEYSFFKEKNPFKDKEDSCLHGNTLGFFFYDILMRIIELEIMIKKEVKERIYKLHTHK